jgi:anti-sigma-K factor RskA
MMNTDIHALAGAYVLDAVDDIERRGFEKHLDECESCRTEVAELREAAARLADPTWSVPSPRLRTDVLAAIAKTRQVGPDVPRTVERDPVVKRWRRFAAGAAAAAVLAAGAAAATWTIQEDRVRDEKVAAASARAEKARIEAILSAPDVRLRTTAMRGGGTVTMAMSASRNEGVVTLAADLSPGPDRAFQLWLGKGAVMTNAGVLPAGALSATTVLSGVVGHDGIGVTVEPAGGSRTPTLPVAAELSLV